MHHTSRVLRRLSSIAMSGGQKDYTHIVIGAGVIGLSIASRLAANRPQTSTLLLERRGAVGTETSSRNSEVIHAGLYYPKDSLKTEMCVRGAEMMYELCERVGVPVRRTGKLILAQNEDELEVLNDVFSHAMDHSIPLRWLSPREVRAREPSVTARSGALWSPRSGILDSHALMQHLHGAFTDAGGDTSLHSTVTGAEALPSGGFKLTVSTPAEADATTVTADAVINAAGLGAVEISNLLLPPEKQRTAYFCKGTYFAYSGRPLGVQTLLYPAPVLGHAGLGTHLTVDMAGRVRFGPDVEWVDDAEGVVPSGERVAEAVGEIRRYLPAVMEGDLTPDYCGVRPKIVGAWEAWTL